MGGLVLALAASATCSKLGTDPNEVVAIVSAVRDSLEEYDTLTPQATALNGAGQPVGAAILWASLDTALTVVDAASGRTVARVIGTTGQLQARVGTLASTPLPVRTLAAADTLFATAATTVDTVTLSDSTPPDSLSGPLSVELADTVRSAAGGDSIVALAGRPVVYAIGFAAATDTVTLVTTDTAHARVAVDTVATSFAGIASVKLRLLSGALPDSVVVLARAWRAVGTPVPDSVAFVVRFRP